MRTVAHIRAGIVAERRFPQKEQKDRDQLMALRSRISNLFNAREIHDREAQAKALTDLRDEAAILELQLARGWREAGLELESPTIIQVHDALPERAVLFDFIVHPVWKPAVLQAGKPVEEGKWLQPHITVFIYHSHLSCPQRINMGAAADIEIALTDYLNSLRATPGNTESAKVEAEKSKSNLALSGRKLYQLLWKPLAEHAAKASVVFVSPDGALGTLPFGSLIGEDGRYLIESHRFAVLVDAGEIVRCKKTRHGQRASMLAMGGVDYGRLDPPPADSTIERDPDRGVYSGQLWSRLPGTLRELEEIAACWKGSSDMLTRLQGSAATEEALKEELPGKRWVHLGTHGFFQPLQLASMEEAARDRLLKEGEDLGQGFLRSRVLGLPPGLLSGLVCAGANLPVQEGRDNGRLTAAEIAFLDLSSCELAVLSACETGLGTHRAGEGMLSVQRAFHAAGTRAVVASMWCVGDEGTADLMSRFYENL